MMRKLLEAMTKFAGEPEQKTGEQWVSTDPGTPGKKLVGDSIIKDLSKGVTPKTKEEELAEAFANFNEDDLGVEEKRPHRTGTRADKVGVRGHKEQPRYKTVKDIDEDSLDNEYEGGESDNDYFDRQKPKKLSKRSQQRDNAADARKIGSFSVDGKVVRSNVNGLDHAQVAKELSNKYPGKNIEWKMTSKPFNEGWMNGSDRVNLPDGPMTYWNGTGRLQNEYNELYEKLVPSQGAAETIEGEVLRASSKIVYRHFNDGDLFNQASFDQLEQYIGRVANYDDLAEKAIEFALKAQGNYHPNTGWDSLDAMDYGPTDDDNGWDEDDEEDDEDDTNWEEEDDELEESSNVVARYADDRSRGTGFVYNVDATGQITSSGNIRHNKKFSTPEKAMAYLDKCGFTKKGELEEGMEEFAKSQAKKRAEKRKSIPWPKEVPSDAEQERNRTRDEEENDPHPYADTPDLDEAKWRENPDAYSSELDDEGNEYKKSKGDVGRDLLKKDKLGYTRPGNANVVSKGARTGKATQSHINQLKGNIKHSLANHGKANLPEGEHDAEFIDHEDNWYNMADWARAEFKKGKSVEEVIKYLRDNDYIRPQDTNNFMKTVRGEKWNESVEQGDSLEEGRTMHANFQDWKDHAESAGYTVDHTPEDVGYNFHAVDPATGSVKGKFCKTHIPQNSHGFVHDADSKKRMAEGKHFRTAYGWAGGRNEKTGKMYKHPDQIKADREANKMAIAQAQIDADRENERDRFSQEELYPSDDSHDLDESTGPEIFTGYNEWVQEVAYSVIGGHPKFKRTDSQELAIDRDSKKIVGVWDNNDGEGTAGQNYVFDDGVYVISANEGWEADLDEDDVSNPVNYTLGNTPDPEYIYSIFRDGKKEGTYHSLEQAKRIVANMKKTKGIPVDYKIKRSQRNKLAGPKGALPEANLLDESTGPEIFTDFNTWKKAAISIMRGKASIAKQYTHPPSSNNPQIIAVDLQDGTVTGVWDDNEGTGTIGQTYVFVKGGHYKTKAPTEPNTYANEGWEADLARSNRERMKKERAAAKPMKPIAKAKPDYSRVFQDINSAIGDTFPDGDPMDALMRKYRDSYGDLNIDLLNKACRVNGAKSYHDYVAKVWQQHMQDNPDLVQGGNPWIAEGKSSESISKYAKELVAKMGHEEALEHALMMANMSRDTKWFPVIRYIRANKQGVAENGHPQHYVDRYNKDLERKIDKDFDPDYDRKMSDQEFEAKLKQRGKERNKGIAEGQEDDGIYIGAKVYHRSHQTAEPFEVIQIIDDQRVRVIDDVGNKAVVLISELVPATVSEGWESGEERTRPVERDPDAEYDARRQEKLDAEADKAPKTTTYQCVGRGPNDEPNYKFGPEHNTSEEAVAYRKKLMANPKTPNPRDIGIRTISKVAKGINEDVTSTDPLEGALLDAIHELIGQGHTDVDPMVLTNMVVAATSQPFLLKDLVDANNNSQAVQHYIDSISPSKVKFSSDMLTVKNEDPAKDKAKAQAGVSSMASRAANRNRLGEGTETPLRDKEDYNAKRKALQQIQMTPGTEKDPQLKAELARRLHSLNQQYSTLHEQISKFKESRGHKIIATKLGNMDRMQNVQIPTPAERQEQLRIAKAKEETGKKQVKEFAAPGANPAAPAGTTAPANDPIAKQKAQQIANASNTIKSATGSSVAAPVLATALDAASKGQANPSQVKAIAPVVNIANAAAKDPKLAGQFKTLANQAKTS